MVVTRVCGTLSRGPIPLGHPINKYFSITLKAEISFYSIEKVMFFENLKSVSRVLGGCIKNICLPSIREVL